MSPPPAQRQRTSVAAGERRDRAQSAPAPDALTPADRYQELFVAVQRSRVFADSKTFVDCAPLREPGAILAAYRSEAASPTFDLSSFVHANFRPIQPPRSEYVSVPGQPLREHIASLWPVLTRHPNAHPPAGSLLQLPHSYVVPGGRFGELYYWDSYFTMLGLAADGRKQAIGDMVENFAYLIDTYGHVPNGTRSYYLGRSQPPVFALMVELAHERGICDGLDFLPQLMQEHAWWMSDAANLANGEAARRVVRMADGSLLNRYWDDRAAPREESWLEDVATGAGSAGDLAQVYRHLRAACESGWDFSTRWLSEPSSIAHKNHTAPARTLADICTTDILPIDLNALLYRLERLVATVAQKAGDATTAGSYAEKAKQRRAAVQAFMWDQDAGAFFDYDWKKDSRRSCLTSACAVALFVGMVDADQAETVAHTLRHRLLAPGGLATTECSGGEQWDRPNGWAPLQWMAFEGLRRYGLSSLADTIAHRWLSTVAAVYEREGKLVEKYALRVTEQDSTQGGRGGEYPLQDGFGWTNGVTAAMLDLYPTHTAQVCRAHAVSHQHR